MYNAVIISVFEPVEIGFIECKNLVAIPVVLKYSSKEEIFDKLRIQQSSGFKRLLAVKFVKIRSNFIMPLSEFKILSGNHKVVEESEWYINPLYDVLELKQIHKFADPAIILQGDRDRIRYRLDYYVTLRQRGYSEEEAINTIHG